MQAFFRLVIGLAFLIPANTFAQAYLFFDGGGGGPAHAGSGGIDSGVFFPRENPRFLAGGAFSVTNNGYPEQPYSPFLHTHVRDEQELSLVGGIRLVRGVYAIGTGGLTDRARRDYLTTNTGQHFLEEYDGTVRGCGSGQLRFVFRKFIFGVGYHSRRGIMVGAGFTFSRLKPSPKR